MKRLIASGLTALFLVSCVSAGHCDTALKKLGRGVCNIGTCPMEILEQTKRVNEEDGTLAALTYGAIKGVAMMGVRAVVGVYEVATFPLPFPKKYEPILKDPEFFSEEIVW